MVKTPEKTSSLKADIMVKASLLTGPLARHLYYFLGFQLVNALVHLVLLSIIAFFHFLLDHRLADIQDWVFFHGWEILGLGKLLSLAVMSRFLGVLSIERRPFFSLIQLKKGIWRKEVFICLVFSLLGLIIIGSPFQEPNYEFSFYRIVVNSFGVAIFFLSEAFLLLALNEWMPLKRGQWPIEIICFSFLSFVIHKSLFVFGTGWDGTVIFHLIMVYFFLKLRGDHAWLHSCVYTVLYIVPLCVFFGVDPLWADKFSFFRFSHTIGGVEVGVFTVLSIFYLRRRRIGYS